MFRADPARIRLWAQIILCAYVALLTQEIVHRDCDAPARIVAAVDNGAAHFAHRIITEKEECTICQSASSQILCSNVLVVAVGGVVDLAAPPPCAPPLPLAFTPYALRAPPSAS